MDSPLEKDTMSEAPFGRISSGRAKTRYEYCLEKELEARMTRVWFVRLLLILNLAQLIANIWLSFS